MLPPASPADCNVMRELGMCENMLKYEHNGFSIVLTHMESNPSILEGFILSGIRPRKKYHYLLRLIGSSCDILASGIPFEQYFLKFSKWKIK